MSDKLPELADSEVRALLKSVAEAIRTGRGLEVFADGRVWMREDIDSAHRADADERVTIEALIKQETRLTAVKDRVGIEKYADLPQWQVMESVITAIKDGVRSEWLLGQVYVCQVTITKVLESITPKEWPRKLCPTVDDMLELWMSTHFDRVSCVVFCDAAAFHADLAKRLPGLLSGDTFDLANARYTVAPMPYDAAYDFCNATPKYAPHTMVWDGKEFAHTN